MHDPMTVAFDIKYPWRKYPKGSLHWPEGYREAAITVWHVNPMEHPSEKGLRGDDSCGWFTPPTTPEEREAIKKLGQSQFATLFSRRHYTREEESFAYLGFAPSSFDAVYWAWRAIKFRDRKGWMYGDRSPALTRREEEAVRRLATNPVDNVQATVERVTDPQMCAEFFGIVYRAYLRHHRPWYRHPRWHVRHWKIQIHATQALKRRLFTRCVVCSRGFAWGESVLTTSWESDGPRWFRSEANVYHAGCGQGFDPSTPSSPGSEP